MLFIVTLHDQRISYSNPWIFPFGQTRPIPAGIRKTLAIHHHENTFYARRIIDHIIPTISLSTNIFSSRSCFYRRRIFFMEHSNFKVFPLIRRRLGIATLLQESIRSSSVERVSIVNTDAILESGFRLWYSQVAPSIRPRLSKHDNNSFRFPRKISSTTELYSNVKTVFTILIRK